VEKVRDMARSQGFDLSVLREVKHEGCTYDSGVGMVLADGARDMSKSESGSGACPPVRTQPNLDLNSYIKKRWYVQQQMPTQYLPADGMNCATAQYTLKESSTFFGWTITVDNRAQYDNGTKYGGEICAYVPDSSNSAKLQVAPCFLPRFLSGPYWVLEYDEEEGYALISGGQPTVETENGCQIGTGAGDAGLWIFTREAFPAEGLVEKVRDMARSQGFDLSVLLPVKHEGCTYG